MDSELYEDEDHSLVEVTPDDRVEFGQSHNELVLDSTWWWASHLAISSIALIANIVFLVTIIYNR